MCFCVHFRRALESQAKTVLTHESSHRVAAHTRHNGSGAELLLLSLIHDQLRIVQQKKRACLFRAVAGSSCDRGIHPFLFKCGAMASSVVSSVLYLRDAAGNHAETRTGAYIYYGDAASFHEWEFRTRLCIAVKLGINSSQRCPKSVTDCMVTHSSRHKKLASIICAKFVDGRPRGIDTLIRHTRGMVFL